MDVRLMFALAAATLVALAFVVAPYGRHARRGWGPSVSARVGWIAMESPVVLAANVRADRRLRALRAPGETGYKIPRGGLHEYVSSPNYLGEIVEWLGWALATWSLPGLAFAVYTIANLAPRALHHHAWYRRTFLGYPRRRKALVPFVL